MQNKVRVYWNSRKKCYSVQRELISDRGNKTWRVNEYLSKCDPAMMLKNCRYYVSGPGRARTLATHQKNVHAWVEGYQVYGAFRGIVPVREITYNPYTSAFFIDQHEYPIFESDYALFGVDSHNRPVIQASIKN